MVLSGPVMVMRLLLSANSTPSNEWEMDSDHASGGVVYRSRCRGQAITHTEEKERKHVNMWLWGWDIHALKSTSQIWNGRKSKRIISTPSAPLSHAKPIVLPLSFYFSSFHILEIGHVSLIILYTVAKHNTLLIPCPQNSHLFKIKLELQPPRMCFHIPIERSRREQSIGI